MTSAPALLIFDLDGVLVDSEALSCAVLAEELTRQGYAISAEAAAARFAGYTDSAVAAEVRRETHLPITEDFPARVARRAIERFRTELKAMPGAKEMLASLQHHPRCVASNSGPERLAAALRFAGLLDCFHDDALFSARFVEHGKPAPDLHLLAASRMGHRPETCLVIEDSPTGVRAARAAGMRAFGFTGASHAGDDHAERLLAEGAERTFGDLSVLPEMIANLYARSR